MRKDDLFWVWLSLAVGENRPEGPILLEQFGSPFEIFSAEAEDLEAVPKLSERVKTALLDKSLMRAQMVCDWCREQRVALCRYGQPEYPRALYQIKNPPLLLYVKGHLPNLSDKLCVGIVGTRGCTEYGAHTAYKIAYELATAGAVTVSGMAKGIDGVAAAATLCAGGLTIAVLGCGLATVYPKAHAGLMHEIVKHGVVLTEYPPFAEPVGAHFPVRNRIISGLSQATLVVEAPLKSGAMITAHLADSQGRELYATPGNVDSSASEGPNRLIQGGAHMVLEGKDLLEMFLAKYPTFLRPEKTRRIGEKSKYDPAVFRKYRMPDYAALARKEIPVFSEEPAEKNPAAPVEIRPAAAQIKTVKKQKENTPAPAEPPAPDHSAEVVAELPENLRKIYNCLPLDGVFGMDQVIACGFSAGELLSAFITLEVKGLIRTLPGGMYQRT